MVPGRPSRGASAPFTLQFKTVNFMALMPVPLGVMTLMLPLLAPDGTLNLILLALSMVTDRCLDLARESCNAQAYEYDCFRCAFELRGAARTN